MDKTNYLDSSALYSKAEVARSSGVADLPGLEILQGSSVIDSDEAIKFDQVDAGSCARASTSFAPSEEQADIEVEGALPALSSFAVRAEQMRVENASLVQMITNLERYNRSLQALVEFENKSPEKKRKLLPILEETFQISRRHACRLLQLPRSTFWYKSKTHTSSNTAIDTLIGA